MLLRPDPKLAEVPGASREQLDALARSVELRRLQLETDIQDYIKQRQAELRSYEQEVRIHLYAMPSRAFGCAETENPEADLHRSSC
jgi:hypothetical protein